LHYRSCISLSLSLYRVAVVNQPVDIECLANDAERKSATFCCCWIIRVLPEVWRIHQFYPLEALN
jgi:hypothetical protein